MACSRPMTVTPSSGRISKRPWQSEHMLGDIGKDQIRAYWRDLIQSDFTKISFDVILMCKAERTKRLHAHVGGAP